MEKIKAKIFKYSFSRNLFLRKITFSIIKNNKLRIFYSSLLLLISSFLISMLINLPVNINNFKNTILSQNYPYKSVIYYRSNAYNSPNISFYGRGDRVAGSFRVFDRYNDINKFVHPTYDTYDPSMINKYHINGTLEMLSISFLAGQAWDKKFLNWIDDNFTGFVHRIICNSSGDPNKNDKSSECITWMIKKNAPGFVSNSLFNSSKFAITFGAIPFVKDKEELFTVVNGFFQKNHYPLNIWGVNFKNNTKLKNLKQFKNTFNSYKNSDTLPVLINKTVSRNYNLKLNNEFNINYLTPEIQKSDEKLSIDKIKLKLSIPSIKPKKGVPSVWTYSGKYKDLKTAGGISSYFYDKKNYLYLTSKYEENEKIQIKNLKKEKKLKVIGITNDYGNARFYTEHSLLNNILEPNNIEGDIDGKYHKLFQDNFFNAKLSTDSIPRDFNTYEVYQPYGDYSTLASNGGTVECKDKSVYFNRNGLPAIENIFSNKMFNYSYNSLLTSFSIFFILVICLTIGISLILISVTNSNILQDNKKNFFVMKALGYTNKEINKIISKVYSYILFFIFFIALIFAYFSTTYILNFIFNTRDIFVPTILKLWEIPLGLFLLFIIYFINKIISFQIIKKLTLSTELKK